jgi:integrase
MPLTIYEIDAAKPGLRPVRQSKEGEKDEKEQKGKKKGKKDKQFPSKGEVSVEGGDPTGNEPDPGFVETDKPYKMADGGGLYLEVDPSGGKYWRFKYRFPKEKRISLGVYPDVGLADARKERDKCRELLAKGIDPGVLRKAQKAARVGNAANSLEVVAREWLKTHVDSKAESHRKRVYARFENDIFPYLGSRPIAEITPMELLGVIKKIEGRGAGDTAHRTLGSCGQVFRFGIATGRCERDITADLRGALKPVEEQNFAAVTTPNEIGGILRAIDGYRGAFVVRSAFRLAPLVFVRPGELRKARWQDMDLDEAEWLLELSKIDNSKARREDVDKYLIVPLSREAVEILRAVQALTGDDKYVFLGARDRNRPMSENAILTAMRRMGISKDEMCGHGFRATARTVLAQELHIRPDLIEHELGHQVIDPNGRAYNRATFLPERRLMMQVWADYLDKLKSQKVIPIMKPKPITDLKAIMVPGYM